MPKVKLILFCLMPAGKTTLLTELCYELFRLLSDEKNSIISLIMAALKLGSDCRQEADSFVETLLRSLQPGRQLVIWFRYHSLPL